MFIPIIYTPKIDFSKLIIKIIILRKEIADIYIYIYITKDIRDNIILY